MALFHSININRYEDFINELDDYNRNNFKTKISSTKYSLKIPETNSIYYLYFK